MRIYTSFFRRSPTIEPLLSEKPQMKRNVLLLFLSQTILVTCASLLIASSPLVGYVLAEKKSLATLPLALLFLTRMVATVPASMFMQRVGRRLGFMTGAVFGLAGAALATMGILLSNFSIFCSGAVLLGVPNGFGQFYRFAAAEVSSETFRSRAISYVLGGGVIAAFVGPNLARWSRQLLPAEFAGSYASLIVLYLFALVVAGLLRMPGPKAFSRASGGRPLLFIARQPAYLVAMASAVVGYGAMNFIMITTPLAMQHFAHSFTAIAFIIQWHVFGMYAPSFFTGHLIRRFGCVNVALTGILLVALCTGVNLAGNSIGHFWWSLLSLGVGWNFLFIGATTLLTKTYTVAEKEKAQALNEFMVFGSVTLTSFSSGAVQHGWGWQTVNLWVVPFLALIFIANLWLRRQPHSPDPETNVPLGDTNA
jgi:MFS family permease